MFEGISKKASRSILLLLVSTIVAGCSSTNDNDFVPAGTIQFRSTLSDGSGSSVNVTQAEVSLWANNRRYSTETDSNGEYSLLIPKNELPSSGTIALSIHKNGFKTVSQSYSAPFLEGTTYVLRDESSRLEICSACVPFPSNRYHELWHLGDDNFGGTANSQFQKSSDADRILVFNFDVPDGASQIRITFAAKGIQSATYPAPSVIRLAARGGTTILNEFSLRNSPDNGGYTTYQFDFDVFESGEHLIGMLTSKNSSNDADDWEFNGMYVESF